MNPSANNWIEKYFSEQKNLFQQVNNFEEIYFIARETGFALGHVNSLKTEIPIDISKWTSEEISKVALLNALGRVFYLVTKKADTSLFIDALNLFYNNIHKETFSFAKRILPQEKTSIRIEKIIDSRIQTKNSALNKNFYQIFTNAILFTDVLAFQHYLENDSINDLYFEKIEEAIATTVSLALQIKQNKTESDENLLKIFEDSLRHIKFYEPESYTINQIDVAYLSHQMERFYLLDICIMCLFSKTTLNHQENDFFYQLGEYLQLSTTHVIESIDAVFDFIRINETDIAHFNSSSLIKNFYTQTTDNILLLLSRNKTRLAKELNNDKELMFLLAKSTTRDLSSSEKELIKKQLLDICKTIPSLTIFLLPGGSLLLPILVKFIPQLLPSSFNENLDIDKSSTN